MITALDTPIDQLDPQERKFVAIMREHGWHHMGVLGDSGHQEFSYSTGFWLTFRHPEIIVFSLPQKVANEVLWDIYGDIRNGRIFPAGVRLSTVFADTDAYLMPVSEQHYAGYLGWSCWFYGHHGFPCLQLVWPDQQGAFPWEASWRHTSPALHPDLTPGGWIRALKS